METKIKNYEYRVLSIQSHVVSGYVGNKSACFPLQVLGFEVDAVNSVQFSNHTGYEFWKGQMLNSEDLGELFEGLKLNDLHHYTHVLTGYVGNVSFLTKVLEVVKELKKLNPSLYFVCDPVMGDNKQMYVPDELLPVYRDSLIPLADLITPNQFEAEILTGITIKSEEDALQAMQILHDKGVETVVITSTNLGSKGKFTVLGSTVRDGLKKSVKVDIPHMPATFLGTGDLFAATLLAWMTKTEGDLKLSCEMVISTIQAVLKRTLKYAEEHVWNPQELYQKLIKSKLLRDVE